MPAGLDLSVITRTGVDVVASHGWDGLSTRSVATALGVTPMALYRYVADAAELRDAVLESIVAASAAVRSTGDLASDLADWARRFRRDLEPHPGVAAHLLIAWFDCPAALDRVESLLALAAEHGIEGFEAVARTNAVFTYVLMRCEAERVIRAAGVVRRSLRDDGTGRPRRHLRILASHYTTARFDAHFEFGLRALVAAA